LSRFADIQWPIYPDYSLILPEKFPKIIMAFAPDNLAENTDAVTKKKKM